MHNGRYAMLLLSRLIAGMPAGTTMEEFCRRATQCLHDIYAKQCGTTPSPERRLCASAVVFSRRRREIWLVGDCQAMVVWHEDGRAVTRFFDNPKPYEADIANRRARLINSGTSPAEARRMIEPDLIKAMLDGQNKRYAVVDGTPIFMPGVRVAALDSLSANAQNINGEPSDGMEIILASDGYPFLFPTLAASEQALASQLKDDPQNIRSYIATKGLVAGNASFDDRAYIRFTP